MSQFKIIQRILQSSILRPAQGAALLTLGLLALQSMTLAAQAMTRQTAIQIAMATAVPLPRTSGKQLQDGVHIFGESKQRDQLGSTYMIFEVKDSDILGAVFAPHSSYSCFEGRFNNGHLALRIDDPYGDEVYLHEIALEQTAIIAANNDLQSVDMQLGLEGMYDLGKVQSAETRLLSSCKIEL